MKQPARELLGGLIGFCVGGTAYCLVGALVTYCLNEQYPPGGAVDLPSPAAAISVIATLCGTPVAAIVGLVAGFAVAARPKPPTDPPQPTP
jgi:hypothetical protein